MKKIIIISMTCNRPDYCVEESVIRGTWGQDIIDGIKFFIYKSQREKETRVSDGAIYVNSPDTWQGTSEKTYKTLKYLCEHEDFDYVVKTNTSSYINIEVLKKFVESLPNDDDNVYGTRIIHNRGKKLLYLGGNFMILPKKIVEAICQEKSIPPIVDDIWLGNVIKKYFEKQNIVFHEKLKRIPTVETFDKLSGYDIGKYKKIIAFRLKTNRRRISKNIIANLKFLEENTKKYAGEFEAPEILEWTNATMDGLREAKYEDALKAFSGSSSNNFQYHYKTAPARARALRVVLNRPITRALQLKRIKFRGLN